jgi:hypothetical protein
MIAQTLVVCGIVIFGLERRWLFPILVLELAVGIVFDAMYQSDLDDLWMNEIFGLWLVAPAYYFKVAGYRT